MLFFLAQLLSVFMSFYFHAVLSESQSGQHSVFILSKYFTTFGISPSVKYTKYPLTYRNYFVLHFFCQMNSILTNWKSPLSFKLKGVPGILFIFIQLRIENPLRNPGGQFTAPDRGLPCFN